MKNIENLMEKLYDNMGADTRSFEWIMFSYFQERLIADGFMWNENEGRITEYDESLI